MMDHALFSSVVKTPRRKSIFGTEDIQSFDQVAKSLLAKFLGTLILVLVGCSASIAVLSVTAPGVIKIAVAFGFVIASTVQIFGDVCGCYTNPAVTVGLVAAVRARFINLIVIGNIGSQTKSQIKISQQITQMDDRK